MKSKLTLAILMTGFVLVACNNATDGDADTDTTNFPADVHGDTSNNINTNTGTYPSDTLPQGTSTQSSSPTDPKSRSTTTGQPKKDTGR